MHQKLVKNNKQKKIQKVLLAEKNINSNINQHIYSVKDIYESKGNI